MAEVVFYFGKSLTCDVNGFESLTVEMEVDVISGLTLAGV